MTDTEINALLQRADGCVIRKDNAGDCLVAARLISELALALRDIKEKNCTCTYTGTQLRDVTGTQWLRTPSPRCPVHKGA